jgi:hypothetical protein
MRSMGKFLGICCISVALVGCGSNSSSSARMGFAGVAPAPLTVMPSSGRGSVATPIVITGTDLSSVTGITLFGTPLQITSVTAAQINAIIPAGINGGTAALVFQSPAGNVSNPSVTFTIIGRDSVLITELGNGGGATNDFEFIEIHNPTSGAIDLTNYYLTDGTDTNTSKFYWKIADNPPNQDSWSGFSSDFLCRFPAGTLIQPGQFLAIGIGDHQFNGGGGSGGGNVFFFDTYGKNPDFEIRSGANDNDGITDMLDLQASNAFTSSSIGTGPGLPNTGEAVILFRWDGNADLVQDVDYFSFGGATTATNPEAVTKTGITVGSSTFLDDTALANQADFATSPNNLTNGFAPFTYQRIDFFEGNEVSSGGNGIAGNDETSENYDQTFADTMQASPGLDYPANPQANATGVSINSPVLYQFYRGVAGGTEPNTTSMTLTGPGGLVPASVSFDSNTSTATLTPNSPLTTNTMYTVTLDTSIMTDGALALGYFVVGFTYTFTTAP